MGNHAHTQALVEVFPQRPVEVLLEASLPRMAGRPEIAFDKVNHLDDPIVMELGSVVEGDGLEHAAVLENGHQSRFVGLDHGAAGQLPDDGNPRLAPDQGNQTRSTKVADLKAEEASHHATLRGDC